MDNEGGLNKINSLMEILTNKEEVREKLKNNPLQAAHLLRLNGYGSINYECACGETPVSYTHLTLPTSRSG